MDVEIRSFIFSSYPHLEECEIFAKLVLLYLKTVSLLRDARAWTERDAYASFGRGEA